MCWKEIRQRLIAGHFFSASASRIGLGSLVMIIGGLKSSCPPAVPDELSGLDNLNTTRLNDHSMSTCMPAGTETLQFYGALVPSVHDKWGRFAVTVFGKNLRCSPMYGLSVVPYEMCNSGDGICAGTHCKVLAEETPHTGNVGCKFHCYCRLHCSDILVKGVYRQGWELCEISIS